MKSSLASIFFCFIVLCACSSSHTAEMSPGAATKLTPGPAAASSAMPGTLSPSPATTTSSPGPTIRLRIQLPALSARRIRSPLSVRLAACVQVSGPITSTYWWQGKIEATEEWVCTAKTRIELYPELEQAIKGAHTYDVSEILATPLVAGNAGYLAWISDETDREKHRAD